MAGGGDRLTIQFDCVPITHKICILPLFQEIVKSFRIKTNKIDKYPTALQKIGL